MHLKTYLTLSITGIAILIAFLTSVHLIRNIFSYQPEFRVESYGTIDFIQYWSANELWLDGQNPYHPQEVLNLQKNLGYTHKEPTMMWNPPWLLPLISPLMTNTFEVSAYYWFLSGIIFPFFAIILFSIAMNFSINKLILALFSSMVFIPIHTSLVFGQIGCLILLGSTLYFIGIKKNLPYLEGFALLVLSAKPHVLYLLVLFRFLKLLRNGDMIYVLKTIAIPLFFILFFLINDLNTIKQWTSSLFGSHPEHIAVKDWIVVSFTGFLRNIIYLVSGDNAPWLMYVVPLISILGLFILKIKKCISEDVDTYFPCLAVSSLFLNPYGWLSDSACLLIIPLLLIGQVKPIKTARTCIFLICIQLACLPFVYVFSNTQHWLFWYPLLLGLVFWKIQTKKQKSLHKTS